MADERVPEWVEREAEGMHDFVRHRLGSNWVDLSRTDYRVLERVRSSGAR
jgi:hypothetical protein